MTLLPHPIIHHPFAYNFGSFGFTGFGLAILLCFLTGQAAAQSELARRGYDPEPVNDMVFAAVIGGLVGAKLYWVVVLGHHDMLFSREGFVYWGGFIGGMLAVMAVVVQKRLGLMRMFDVCAPACAAAYAVGRTGCWAVGDDYGRPWNGFLAVAFPEGVPASYAGVMQQEFNIPMPEGATSGTLLSVYPTQLFEVALGFVMFLLLWRMRDHKHAEGWLWGVFCILSGLERFFIEFFRAKDDVLPIGITYAQSISIVFILIGVAFLAARWKPGTGIYAASAERRPA